MFSFFLKKEERLLDLYNSIFSFILATDRKHKDYDTDFNRNSSRSFRFSDASF